MSYQHPGVYIEELPSGSAPIEAASTSTALIVGYATKGPVGVPTLLFNFDQYTSQFGGINDFKGKTPAVDYMGHSVQAFFNNGGSKAYIVRVALNGSTTATQLTAANASLILPAGGSTPTKAVKLSALNPGTWGNGMIVNAVSNGATPPLYKLSVGRLDRQSKFVAIETYTDVTFDDPNAPSFISTQLKGVSNLIVGDAAITTPLTTELTPYQIGSLTSDDLTGAAVVANSKLDVTLDAGPNAITVTFQNAMNNLSDIAAFIQDKVRGNAPLNSPRHDFTCTVENNRLVLRSGGRGSGSAVAVAGPTTPPPPFDAAAALKLTTAGASAVNGAAAANALFATNSAATLAGGSDGLLPGLPEYSALFPQLKKLRDISIIFLPGQTWPANQDVVSAFIGHAETMKNRMVIVDPSETKEFTSSLSFAADGFPSSTYSVTYYPWLEVANPWYQAELRPDRQRTVFIPPSGFAAGLWARTDGRRGVWKAPAGLQASLLGAASTKFRIGDDEQDQLNPVGVNCFRRIISDIVIWGSRTLATKTDPEWRYVPVRRTAMMIEESVYQGIQWAVFEPNDHRLWSSLRLNIGAFMDSLFRAGAFQGEKASDAYFVRCGLGDTMTQGDIDAGQVIVLVGFAPVKPAEFVIVRIQQIVGKQ